MTGLTSSNGDLTCLLPGYQNEIVSSSITQCIFSTFQKAVISTQ